MVIFETIRWKNFMSYGNVFSEIDLCSHKTNLIGGKNGNGKCVRGSTEITISPKNSRVLEAFQEFQKKKVK